MTARRSRPPSVSNAPLRERFERLAASLGRTELAEHVAVELGWTRDRHGRAQDPRDSRRGVTVVLGLEPNRHGQVLDRITVAIASRVSAVLDEVDRHGLRPVARRSDLEVDHAGRPLSWSRTGTLPAKAQRSAVA